MPLKMEGIDEVRIDIQRMQRGVRDISDAGIPVARYLGSEVRKQINSKGSHFGTPWAPLKPSYLQWKIQHGFPRTILVKTGDLRRSFVRPSDLIDATYPDKIVLRSKDFKAILHQTGAGHLPIRPILKLTPDVKKGIREIVAGIVFGDGRGKRYV